MNRSATERLARLGYDDFRALAADTSLDQYEKIGTLGDIRRGKEEAILEDIVRKVPALSGGTCRVMDIGPGCSDLPRMLMQLCAHKGHELLLLDSAEMLALLPDDPGARKIPARFPQCADLLAQEAGRLDVVLAYSVLHYVFQEANVWDFLDRSLSLLAPGGTLLLGDVPNVSKRKRFLASAAGERFHKQYMKTQDAPTVEFNRLEVGNIDDSVITGLLMRGRSQGFDAYVLAQPAQLPMANRREDLLFIRP